MLVPAVAVGTAGTPVNVGDARGAAPSAVIACEAVMNVGAAVAPELFAIKVLAGASNGSVVTVPLFWWQNSLPVNSSIASWPATRDVGVLPEVAAR